MRALRYAALLFLVMVVAAPLQAGETGSVSGTVKDSQGGVIPGATVRIAGELLPAGLERTTSQTGTYQFQRLLPGVYRVEGSLSGMGTAVREVRVFVDVDAQIDLVAVARGHRGDRRGRRRDPGGRPEDHRGQLQLHRGRHREAAARPAATRACFSSCPASPTTTASRPTRAAAARTTRSWSTASTSPTPASATSRTEINELDIAEFNVKRGAITAEFGRSSGVVTNAVTRSGHQRRSPAAARFEMHPRVLRRAETKDETVKEKRDRWIPAVVAGRARSCGTRSGGTPRAAVPLDAQRPDATTLGPIPDEKTTTDEYFGKITARPTSSTSSRRPTDTARRRWSTPASASTTTRSWRRTTRATNKIVSVDLELLPHGPDRRRPQVPAPRRGERDDRGHRPGRARRLRRRTTRGAWASTSTPDAQDDTVGGASPAEPGRTTSATRSGELTQFLDLGDHVAPDQGRLRLRGGEEDLTRISNAWGNVALVQTGTQYAANYYPDQPPQLGDGATYSIFVQDAITIGSPPHDQRRPAPQPRRVHRRRPTPADTFLIFGFGDQVQPRARRQLQRARGRGRQGSTPTTAATTPSTRRATSRSLAPTAPLHPGHDLQRATGRPDLGRAAAPTTTGKVLDPEHEAHLPGRVPGRLRDAAGRRLGPRRLLHVSRPRAT